MAAGASSTSAGTRPVAWSATHSAAFPPNDVPIRLKESRPILSIARTIVDAISAMVSVRVFTGESPKPGISNATTRNWRARRSCAGVSRNPPAPCKWTSGTPSPACM